MAKKPTTAPVATAADNARGALAALRETVRDLTHDDREALAAWERQIKLHEERANWLAHPITQDIFGKAAEQVALLNRRLSTEETMKEDERRAIFKGKSAFLWLLTLFAESDDDLVLERLAEEIEKRTQEFREFNTQLGT